MKTFTEEEIEKLSKNPNTYQVSSTQITLTLAAKQRAMQLVSEGHSGLHIMKELGYDISILGESRARGVVNHIKKQFASKEGLHEGYKSKQPKRTTIDALSQLPLSEEAFDKLKSEVVYLRQEVEFLKKISSTLNTKKRGGSL